MDKHEYRTFGALYVILGIELCFFFLLNRGVRVYLFPSWNLTPRGRFEVFAA